MRRARIAAPSCGDAVRDTSRITFALLTGGIVCEPCRSRQRQTISVRRNVIDEMKRLQSPETTLPTEVPSELYGELRAILNRYIQSVVGSVPRMQAHFPVAQNRVTKDGTDRMTH